MRSGIMPAEYADLLIDALEDPDKDEDAARYLFQQLKMGNLDKLVSFESLLMLGSPRVFRLGD